MKYNFDVHMERRGTNCEKWDLLEEEFGRKDLLALWVADMDFPAPPEVLEALHRKIDEGALGYPIAPDSLLKSVAEWQRMPRVGYWKRCGDMGAGSSGRTCFFLDGVHEAR